MPGLTANLPVPSAVGVGAAVSVVTFGKTKTIVVGGNIVATMVVEASGGGGFCPVAVFTGPGTKTLEIAADEMRVRVIRYKRGTANCDVSGDDAGTTLVALPVPGADGVGAAVDVSSLGLFKTAFITSDTRYAGLLQVEFSGDNTDWAQGLPSFPGPGGCASGVIAAQWARVRRKGYSSFFPGSPPVCYLGAAADAGGGGGGGLQNVQAFTYTATGAEGSDFNVSLPAARASTSYGIWWSIGDAAVIFSARFPRADRALAQFRVLTTTALTAGDEIDFIVADI